jgi:hypothetical protein
MLCKDKIAGKEYLYLNSIEELGFDIVQNINLENFLVGVAEGKGRVRLVTNERMLVVINASNAAAVYKHINNKVLPFSSSPIQKVDDEGIDSNYMSFDAVGGHAHFHLSCKQCVDGKEFSYQYDFIGKIHKNINQENLSMYADYSSRSVILFPLTNLQASNVYNTVESFYNQSEAGKYKTVPIIENCITFLNRVYNASNFDGAFLDYMTSTEIMDGKEDVFAMGFSQNHYQAPKFIDPNRTKVREFAIAALGEGFEKNWNQHDEEPINYELAKNNSFILERIETIIRSWELVCTALHKNMVEIWNFKITDKALSKLCDKEPTSITYFDLYYYYTFKYMYEMQDVFKDTAYAQYLNDHPALDGVDLICHVKKYKDLCMLSLHQHMESDPPTSEPCHITEDVRIRLNNVLELESKTALIEKLDQCFVIDENMLSTCPNVNAYNSFTPSDIYSSNDWGMCMVLP